MKMAEQFLKAMHGNLMYPGTVQDGAGYASVYQRAHPAEMEAYRRALGWMPHPGTLNVRAERELDWDRLEKVPVIEGKNYIVRAWLIMPENRGIYTQVGLVRLYKSGQPKNVVEVMAATHLRAAYQVKTGERVTVVIDA